LRWVESPDTSEELERLLFSGYTEGPLPYQNEDIERVYSSDTTDLEVYDYINFDGEKPSSDHLAFFFTGSDHVMKLDRNTADVLDKAVQLLEKGVNQVKDRYGDTGFFSRFTKFTEQLDFEHSYIEYIEDLKQVEQEIN